MSYIGSPAAPTIATVSDDTVTTAKLADDAITSAKITDGAVTPSDLSTGHPNWDSSGNVGIGTSSPSYALDVYKAGANYPISWGNGTSRGILYTDNSTVIVGTYSNTPLQFITNNSAPQMTLNTSGNVGIGTTPSSGKLHIYPSPGTTSVRIDAGGTLSGARRNWGLSTEKYSAGAFSIESGSSEGAAPSVERMRIDSSGRVTMPYQPAFSAYPSSKSISGSGAETEIVMEYTLYNNGSHYNTSTGIFTCPVAGYYFASAMARWETGAFTQSSYIRLYISKNNSNYNSTYIHCINGNNEAWQNYMGMSVSGVVKCAANDTLRLKGGMDAGAAQLHAESGFHVMLLG